MRWLVRIFVGLIVIIAVAVGGGYVWLRGSLPQTDGTVSVKGPGSSLEITRDRHGIPHIYAKSDNDAWFGLGYAHAQDRLWQMEMNRRIGAGRLSEILGSQTVQTDRFLRTLSVYHHAENTVANLSDEARAAMESYAAGVNAYIAGRGGIGAPLPPEFLILGVEPEPWKPADSLVWAKMMAWDLGANWRKEVLRFRLVKAGLSQQHVAELFPPYPGDAPVALPDIAALYQDIEIEGTEFAGLPEALLPDPANGSNNWVISGARTASGKPLLANDPHLGLAAPPVWYFAHVDAPGLKAMGATLPGIPGIVLGRNERIAWGFTNTGPDVQDMFIERLVAGDPKSYVTPTGTAKFQLRKEVIKVKDADDISLEVRTSRHGPIISDASRSAAEVAGDGHVLAFAWTALRDDSGTAEALIGSNKAANWDEFVAAIRHYDVPQQNMVFADIDGNIGMYAPGRVPVRKPENKVQGFFPVPGWEAAYDWDGFIPFEELPHTYNPARGYVATANHKIVPPDYAHHITFEWAAPYRARRIEDLLTGREKHTVDSVRMLQGDVRSVMATDFMPRLLEVKPTAERSVKAYALLANWDGEMDRNKPEPLIFNAWFKHLGKTVYADELGDMFKHYWDVRPVFMSNVLMGGQAHWCDNVKTAPKESCNDVILKALDAAVEELAEEMDNDDPAAWRWGERHVAYSDHNPFTHVGPLARFFDISIPSSGDGYTVNVGKHRISDPEHPYRQYHGPSLRAIYDFADLDRSRWIHTTGQSGNPFSPFHGNFAQTWRDVGDIPMTMKRDAIMAGAIGTLKLNPVP